MLCFLIQFSFLTSWITRPKRLRLLNNLFMTDKEEANQAFPNGINMIVKYKRPRSGFELSCQVNFLR